MPIQYKDILPWGRSFDEYARMFDLTASELKLPILGCGDGPASFNVECNRDGGRVTSIDPLYRFSHDAIESRIAETYDEVMQQTGANQERFQKYNPEIRAVNYEFQRGGNKMLVLRND